jgi:hypothetical protein
VAGSVHHEPGGIRSLAAELKAHGGAINHDLIQAGWTRHDIGVRLGWGDLRDFLQWLPPTGDSAWYRARKPNTWWVTPELQMMAGLLYASEGANWQRGGGKGSQPKPFKFPVEPKVGDIDSAQKLIDRKQRLQRRREKRDG